jgi:hypothetical protein
MALTGPYGRQWISPKASLGFSSELILADKYCSMGRLNDALCIYRLEAKTNYQAERRLNIARRQLKKMRNFDITFAPNKLCLGFIDWYHGFHADMKGILNLFEKAGVYPVISSPEEADILIVGAYGDRLLRDKQISRDKLVILFTGENICPSYDIHDFSISTRHHSYCGKNIRYPQWLGELEFQGGEIAMKTTSDDDFCLPGSRDLAITAIYNNSTPEREEMLYYLKQEFGPDNVHVFGSQRTGQVNKFQILSRTVIAMCFENSVGDGYITEKLLHARAFGCKALYWGDSSYSLDFQSNGIINTYEVSSLNQIFSWCRSQFRKTTLPNPGWRIVDPNIFSKAPDAACNSDLLSQWISIVTAWRGFKHEQFGRF